MMRAWDRDGDGAGGPRRGRATGLKWTLFALGTLLGSISLTGVALSDQVKIDRDGYMSLPGVPDLEADFSSEKKSGKTPGKNKLTCEEIQRNPKAEDLDCWSDYITAAANQLYERQKGRRGSIRAYGCFPGTWEIKPEPAIEIEEEDIDTTLCPYGGEQECQRPDPGDGFKLEPLVPALLRKDALVIAKMADQLAHEYTVLQYLRRGHDKNRFNSRLTALTLKQAMLVLYETQRVLRLRDDFSDQACAFEHVESQFDLAENLAQEMRSAVLPPILEVSQARSDVWVKRLYEVQIDVLSGRSMLQNSSRWVKHCDAAEAESSDLGGWDADLYAWCGYARYRLGELSLSREVMNRSRQSINNPDVSGYASWAIRSLLEE